MSGLPVIRPELTLSLNLTNHDGGMNQILISGGLLDVVDYQVLNGASV